LFIHYPLLLMGFLYQRNSVKTSWLGLHASIFRFWAKCSTHRPTCSPALWISRPSASPLSSYHAILLSYSPTLPLFTTLPSRHIVFGYPIILLSYSLTIPLFDYPTIPISHYSTTPLFGFPDLRLSHYPALPLSCPPNIPLCSPAIPLSDYSAIPPSSYLGIVGERDSGIARERGRWRSCKCKGGRLG